MWYSQACQRPKPKEPNSLDRHCSTLELPDGKSKPDQRQARILPVAYQPWISNSSHQLWAMIQVDPSENESRKSPAVALNISLLLPAFYVL
jgi:hypothetical protein